MGAIDYKKLYDEMVADLTQLRRRSDQADADFLIRCWQYEQAPETRMVVANAVTTFEAMLAPLVTAGRYRAFAQGIEKLDNDVEQARLLGAEMVVAIGKKAPPERVDAAVVEASAWVQKHARYPTQQTANSLVSNVHPVVKQGRAVRELTSIERMRLEIRTLKAKLRKVSRERDALKRKCERLVAKGAVEAPPAKTARKPRSK